MKNYNKIKDYIFTKQWYKPIFYVFIIILFLVIPVNANMIVNGDFETGNTTGWTYTGATPAFGSWTDANFGDIFGDYVIGINYNTNLYQIFDPNEATELKYWATGGITSGYVYLYNEAGTSFYGKSFSVSSGTPTGWQTADISGRSYVKIRVYSMGSENWANSFHVDNFYTVGDYVPVTVLSFDKTPYYENNDTIISWDISDYKGTYANELFRLDVITNGTIRGTNFTQSKLLNPYDDGTTGKWYNHLYDLLDDNVSGTYQAKVWYEYYDPVFHSGYILDSYILTDIYSDNYTYVPPEPPEEPEEPEIPNATEYPDIPIDPPNATSINQTVNTSWSEGYYNVVDGTIESLCSPTYNFTYWLLQPITDLTTSINDYSVYMNDSFNKSSTGILVLSGSINTITNGLHPKVKNLITYYLVWLVLLLIMRKR